MWIFLSKNVQVSIIFFEMSPEKLLQSTPLQLLTQNQINFIEIIFDKFAGQRHLLLLLQTSKFRSKTYYASDHQLTYFL